MQSPVSSKLVYVSTNVVRDKCLGFSKVRVTPLGVKNRLRRSEKTFHIYL